MCNFPLRMYWTGGFTANGKKEYSISPSYAYSDKFIDVPCGQCMACRLRRSADTAQRAVHEASCYERNCFLTLTVSDENLDKVFPGGSLDHRPFQLFMKRLRKEFSGYTKIVRPDWFKGKSWNEYPIRVLMCGEYGELLSRPHYHCCIFNFDFEDKEIWSVRHGVRLYRSNSLEELWPYGYSTIGEVTFESARYLAKYVTKKVTGTRAYEHYFNAETGEIRKSEYIQFPRGFGLGRLWFDKYGHEIYASDSVVLHKNGGYGKVRPAKYYDSIFDLTNPDSMSIIKRARRDRARLLGLNCSADRLLDKERYLWSIIDKFNNNYRSFENATQSL